MKIIDCEQRSAEWFEARKGVLTASQMGPWLIGDRDKNKAKAKAWKSAIYRLLAIDPEPPIFQSAAMTRGIELEPEARVSYESRTGYEVTEVGFCRADGYGCSPDGLIYRNNDLTHGVEIKCPLEPTHLSYLLEGGLPEAYEIQVHSSMAITGTDRWDFYSYHPKRKPHLFRVERSEFTESLKRGLDDFSVDLAETRKRLEELEAQWLAEQW